MNNFLSFIGILFIVMVAVLLFVQPPIPPKLFIETIKPWPPKLGEPYPDLDLIDQDGRVFRLSEYKGKVILLQPVAINSSVSQAFSGAKKLGAFENVPLLGEVAPISNSFSKYTNGLHFPNKELVFIQIVLYGMNFQQPSQQEVSNWAKHFGLKVANNQIVAFSPHDLRSLKSYGMIPGFQLIDKGFILQADSTGPNPKDDLYKTLLSMVPIAINAEKR